VLGCQPRFRARKLHAGMYLTSEVDHWKWTVEKVERAMPAWV
jgi:hypothetical protein